MLSQNSTIEQTPDSLQITFTTPPPAIELICGIEIASISGCSIVMSLLFLLPTSIIGLVVAFVLLSQISQLMKALIALLLGGISVLDVVGFDLDEIAWSAADSADWQAFVLQVINCAIAKHRCSFIDYKPPFAQAHLQALRDLVLQYSRSFIQADRDRSWLGKRRIGVRFSDNESHSNSAFPPKRVL